MLSLSLELSVQNYLKLSLNGEKNSADDIEHKLQLLLQRLAVPPSFTTVRVNVLKEKVDNVKAMLQEALDKQYEIWKETVKVSCHPKIADALIMRNTGPHKIIQMNTEVIVDFACGMAVLRGANVFAQGIMGSPSSMCAGDRVSVFADVDGKCFKGFIQPFQGHKVFVGNGIARLSRYQLFCGHDKASGVGIEMTEPLYSAPSLSDVLSDVIFPQNLPSIVCGHVLDPQPGERVLDMCSAPGGKTTHIATLMQDRGILIALDKSKNRTAKISENVARWGLQSVQVYAYDSTKAVCNKAESSGGPPYPPASFDRVLLDAPCSALGQRPSLRNSMAYSTITSYPTLQKKLFKKAVEILKQDGILVYSTCTLTLDENEALVTWALHEFPELKLAVQKLHLGGPGWLCPGLSEENRCLLQRFDPTISAAATQITPDIDTIGFFIAKFIKLKK